MNNDRIEKNQLKEISRQRDISFSNVLATYIAEKIIISVNDSAYQKELWLKDQIARQLVREDIREFVAKSAVLLNAPVSMYSVLFSISMLS